MYGLIGKMRTVPGRRMDVIKAMGESTVSMPGCRSYVIAEDPTDADAIWVTEVWDDEASHKASLQIPAVQASIKVVRPLIAGFDVHFVTRPVAIF